MAKNVEKKIVLVIVEGETDAESLTVSLGEVFANEEVAVEITRQDITGIVEVRTTGGISRQQTIQKFQKKQRNRS